MRLLVFVLVFTALNLHAECRQVKLKGYSDVAHYERSRVVAVSAVNPFGGQKVFIEGVSPRVAMYVHRKTKCVPQRAILRAWDTILRLR